VVVPKIEIDPMSLPSIFLSAYGGTDDHEADLH